MSFDLKRARRVFEIYDADNSGTIDADEISAIMRALGLSPTREEVDRMIAKADTTGQGELTFEDFCTVMQSAEPGGDGRKPQPPSSPNAGKPSAPAGGRVTNTPHILRASHRKRDKRKEIAKRFRECPNEFDYFEQMKKRQAEGALNLQDLLTNRVLDSLDTGFDEDDEAEDSFATTPALAAAPATEASSALPAAQFAKRGTISISLLGSSTEEGSDDPTLQHIGSSDSRRRTTVATPASAGGAGEDPLGAVIKLLEGRFHNVLMVLSKRIDKLTNSCKENGNVAGQDKGIEMLREVTKELSGMAALAHNSLRMIDPKERASVAYPEPDTVEEATTAASFLTSKLVDLFQKLLPKVKRWRKKMVLEGKGAQSDANAEIVTMTESLQKFDPQITHTVLTIDAATRYLEDDQSFKKAAALLILGMRWKRLVARRRAARAAAEAVALPGV
jgi:hypothetical protein